MGDEDGEHAEWTFSFVLPANAVVFEDAGETVPLAEGDPFLSSWGLFLFADFDDYFLVSLLLLRFMDSEDYRRRDEVYASGSAWRSDRHGTASHHAARSRSARCGCRYDW